MPTDSFFSSAGDGQVINFGASSWANARSGTGGTTAKYDTDAEDWGAYAEKDGGGVRSIYRGFLAFDTSSIPDDATITSARLRIYPSTVGSGAGGYLCLVAGSQASTSALATSDYNSVGSTDLATRVLFSALSGGAYNDLTLNTAGKAAINLSGFTKLALRASQDVDNSEPTGGTWSGCLISMSEQTGTSKDPILEVTWTPATTSVSASDTASFSESAAVTVQIGASAVVDPFDGSAANLESYTTPAGLTYSRYFGTNATTKLRLSGSGRAYVFDSSTGFAVSTEYRLGVTLPDGFAEVPISIVSNIEYAGVVMRASGTDKYAAYILSGVLYLIKVVSGSASTLATYTIPGYPASGYTLRLTTVGSAITVSLDGATVISVTDTSLTTGAPGLTAGTNGACSTAVGMQFDSLSFGSPVGVETVTFSEGSPSITDPSSVAKSASDTVTVADSSAVMVPIASTGTTPIPSGTAPSASGSKVQISPADGRYNCFATGAKAANGDFLATYLSATSHTSGGPAKQARSTNSGTSWGTPTTESASEPLPMPEGIVKLANGDLLRVWYEAPGGGGGAGLAYACYVQRSSDHGVTWGTAVQMDAASPAFTQACAIMGAPIQLASGRLLAAVFGQNTTDPVGASGYQHYWCRIIYSDDNGDTWAPLSTPVPRSASHSYEEPMLALVTTSTGGERVVLAYRRDDSDWSLNGYTAGQIGGYQIQFRYSDDGGTSWSSEVGGPSYSSGTPAIVQAQDGSVMVCYRKRAASGYNTPYIGRSTDYGASFTEVAQVEASGSHLGCGWIVYTSGAADHLYLVYSVEVSASVANVYSQKFTVAAPSSYGGSGDAVAFSDSASATVGVGSTAKSASDAVTATDASAGVAIVLIAAGADVVAVADTALATSVDSVTTSETIAVLETFVQMFETVGTTFTVHAQGMVPGTAIAAYLRWQWKGPVAARLNAGPGAPVRTATVGDDLTAAFPGLQPGEYVAYAPAYPQRRLFFMVTE